MVALLFNTPPQASASDSCGCKSGMLWTRRALGALVPLAALRIGLAPGRRTVMTSVGLVAGGVFVAGAAGKAVGIARYRRSTGTGSADR